MSSEEEVDAQEKLARLLDRCVSFLAPHDAAICFAAGIVPVDVNAGPSRFQAGRSRWRCCPDPRRCDLVTCMCTLCFLEQAGV